MTDSKGRTTGTRQCSRPGCSAEAAATLTYSHERATAWLAELTPRREPHSYDLCGPHADGITVLQRWRLESVTRLAS